MPIALLTIAATDRPAVGKIVGPPEVAWKDMTFAQKKSYMKVAVTPTMKPIFQAFDAKKFKTFNCETCHGRDGADRKFKMPSNDIKPLPNTPEAFQAKLKAEPTWPKWTEFMAQKVEPAMGKPPTSRCSIPRSRSKGRSVAAVATSSEGAAR